MTVRAKFHVSEVSQYPGTEGGKVTLTAVSRGDRNADWATATPSGTLTMQINNPPAFEFFQHLLEDSWAAKRAGLIRHPEVFITIEASTDGYPDDGHPFVKTNRYTEGVWYHDKCAVCGRPVEEHLDIGDELRNQIAAAAVDHLMTNSVKGSDFAPK